MFKNKEQIENILKMNITDKEKKNLIANIKNIKTDISRVIAVDRELDLKVGDIWDNQDKSTSWTDDNKDLHSVGFQIENHNEIVYLLVAENIEGYEVQYLDFELLTDEGIDEDEAEEISEDETYLELMDLLGADADMRDEREILVPKETKFEIAKIYDGREDEGFIEIILKEVK